MRGTAEIRKPVDCWRRLENLGLLDPRDKQYAWRVAGFRLRWDRASWAVAGAALWLGVGGVRFWLGRWERERALGGSVTVCAAAGSLGIDPVAARRRPRRDRARRNIPSAASIAQSIAEPETSTTRRMVFPPGSWDSARGRTTQRAEGCDPADLIIQELRAAFGRHRRICASMSQS
jgi:hypothetical protein